VVSDLLVGLIGAPFVLERLKVKPGRRRTLRASGPRGRVIVKLYATPRAGSVAARLSSLAGGPVEPIIPKVLAVGPDERSVVLSEVPGQTLGASLLDGPGDAPTRAGRALGRWHRAWSAAPPAALRPHSVERELEILEARMAGLAPAFADRIRRATPVGVSWAPVTVVHRDLYEEQILVADRVGLIDLDDVALGPPELDLGNLLAHLDLLELRSGHHLGGERDKLVNSYRAVGLPIDDGRLEGCRRLSLLRLAAIHHCEPLLDLVTRRPLSSVGGSVVPGRLARPKAGRRRRAEVSAGRVQEPMLHRPQRGLGAVHHAEAREDAGEVRLHRLFGDTQA